MHIVMSSLLDNSFQFGKKKTCVYCQGGIRASHSYWVLRHLGYTDVTVYDGSWAEYGDSNLPVEGAQS